MDRQKTRMTGRRLAEDFRALSDKILRCELHNMQRADFLREASHVLADFSGCDSVKIQLMEARNRFTSEVKRGDTEFFRFETEPLAQTDDGVLRPRSMGASALERLCDGMLNSHHGPTPSNRRRSFWTEDPNCGLEKSDLAAIADAHPSLAIIPSSLDPTESAFCISRATRPVFLPTRTSSSTRALGRFWGLLWPTGVRMDFSGSV